MSDEPEKHEPEEPAKPEAPNLDEFRTNLMSELDTRLQARDKAILEGMQQLVASMREPAKPAEPDKVRDVEITPQELYDNPGAALAKFFEHKMAPLLEKVKESPKDDGATVNTMVEVQKMKLRERVGIEEFTKYSSYLDKVIDRTDPKVLADTQGMDAIWRLTKSYADDFISSEEHKRQEKIAKAQLEKGVVTPAKEARVELSSEEQAVAERMGVSPELYKKYSGVEEIEIGGNKKK